MEYPKIIIIKIFNNNEKNKKYESILNNIYRHYYAILYKFSALYYHVLTDCILCKVILLTRFKQIKIFQFINFRSI